MVALFAQQSNIIEFPPTGTVQGKSNSQKVRSSQDNEWYTPHRYCDAARLVMGNIDLDPASCSIANQMVKATRYYSKEDDGLAQEWYGNVWLNPPYKTEERISLQSLWVQKTLQEYRQGHIRQAILCVTGVVERKWFEPLWNHVVCFPNHQIHFKVIDSQKYHHPYGTVFVYLGTNEQKFIDVFSQFGTIAKRVSTPRQKVTPLSLWEVQP